MGINSKMNTVVSRQCNNRLANVQHSPSKRRKPGFKIKLKSEKSYSDVLFSETNSPTTYGTKITEDGRIYITDASQATNPEFINRNQITAIITLSRQPLPTTITSLLNEGAYKFVEIMDTCNSNIQLYFNDCIDFIKENSKNGRVLVHCQAGI